MTISPNKVELGNQQQEEDEEEERVYVAGQILAGNLDKQLDTSHNGEDDLDNGLQQPPDLGEKRGRTVLAIFNLADQKGHGIPSRQPSDQSLAESATKVLASQKDPIGIPSTPKSKSEKDITMWKVLRQPILSMAHVGVANGLVDRALKCDDKKLETLSYTAAKTHLQCALELWPCNPSAMLAMANLTRMGVVPMVDLSQAAVHAPKTDDASVRQRMQLAMHQYVAAAKCANSVRWHAIKLLVGPHKLKSTDDLFLVETIVLGPAAQVEAMDDDNDKDENNNDEYGPSRVVSTASYMAALLASTLGHHNVAKEALAAFGKNVTRIHPCVWDAAAQLAKNHHSTDESTTKLALPTEGESPASKATAGAFTPSTFRKAIPKDLARILRHAFRPDAPYWDQSGYDRGVYYSFWHDYHRPPQEESKTTTTTKTFANVVEELIAKYLLPRVKQVLGEEALSELAGFEWWVHTRPHGANLGHQLHFDTDEALLEQDQIVSFPISATVLYLNEDGDHDDEGVDDANHHHHHFGATVLFDQTPYCKKNADRAWISTPQPRSFLVFPGDLLHGVLPCAPVGGDSASSKDADSSTTTSNNNNKKNKSKRKREPTTGSSTQIDDREDPKVEQPHRLTFMVNFWARNIPGKLKKRKLYGPSGPFPPMTRRHSWTNDLLDGGTYPRTVNPSTSSKESPVETTMAMGTLTCVEPAWELLNHDEETRSSHDDGSKITKTTAELSTVDLPPSGINQRFFVKNAPDFFHSTLFEK